MKVLTDSKFPVKMWTDGVPVEPDAEAQVLQVANLPFIYRHVAVMPDVHVGAGSTVGCVIPTVGAVVPAAVGVDIGCGMCAVPTDIRTEHILENRPELRKAIENAVPMGRSDNGGRQDIGAWQGVIPDRVAEIWDGELSQGYLDIGDADFRAISRNSVNHLGTLGTGNHFIELSGDEDGFLWVVLHSGSRGPGNRIGSHYTRVAKDLCEKWFVDLPAPDLAYLPEHTDEFRKYRFAVKWAQQFAAANRLLMLRNVMDVLGEHYPNTSFGEVINCHHNYIAWERHFGLNVMVTRKGAVRAQAGDLGFIPGSMGARSYVVRGLGNRESFCSCSHGAGRVMSRTQAKKTFTIEDHIRDTEGVECLKDRSVIDETPRAYKDIDKVMAAQADLVEPVHTLKQVLCCKGVS